MTIAEMQAHAIAVVAVETIDAALATGPGLTAAERAAGYEVTLEVVRERLRTLTGGCEFCEKERDDA